MLEEAGVLGRLGRCLGIFEVSNVKYVLQSDNFYANNLHRVRNINIEQKFSFLSLLRSCRSGTIQKL